MSRQAPLELKTQRMPLSINRSSLRGRPIFCSPNSLIWHNAITPTHGSPLVKERVVKSIKKLWSFTVANHVLLLCLAAIFLSMDLIDARSWSYDPEPAEVIADAVSEGLDHIAGAILLGATLLALTIRSRKKPNIRPEPSQQRVETD